MMIGLAEAGQLPGLPSLPAIPGTPAVTVASGAAAVTAQPPSSVDLYLAGLKTWLTPSSALSVMGWTFSNLGTAFSGSNLPVVLGVWTPPLVIAALVLGGTAYSRRRR